MFAVDTNMSHWSENDELFHLKASSLFAQNLFRVFVENFSSSVCHNLGHSPIKRTNFPIHQFYEHLFPRH